MKTALIVAIIIFISALSLPAQTFSISVKPYLNGANSSLPLVFTNESEGESDQAKIRKLVQTIINGFPLPHVDNGYDVAVVFGTAVLDEQYCLGTDIAASLGTPVLAVGNGTVAHIGYDDDLGNYVVINHGSSLETIYAHLVRVVTHKGAAVKTGDALGNVGATGVTEQPVLHLAIKYHDEYLNPVIALERFNLLK
jgi:Peptidase family M23